jgi:hypothetical protein
MASHFFRRRNFVPNPRFQFLLAGKGVSYVFLYGVVIVYTTLQWMAETMYILPLNCLTPEVKARVWAFPTESLLLSLLIALIVVLQIIQWSHRVAGPEFRLKRILREMAAGQYPECVRLRKHDCLKGLAENLTLLAQALRQRRQAHADQLARLHGEVQECAACVRSGEGPEVVLAQLQVLAKRVGFLEQLVAGDNTPEGAGLAPAASMSRPVEPASIRLSCGKV